VRDHSGGEAEDGRRVDKEILLHLPAGIRDLPAERAQFGIDLIEALLDAIDHVVNPLVGPQGTFHAWEKGTSRSNSPPQALAAATDTW
jgi:hypothetical protein